MKLYVQKQLPARFRGKPLPDRQKGKNNEFRAKLPVIAYLYFFEVIQNCMSVSTPD
jgi:hypothetical protein